MSSDSDFNLNEFEQFLSQAEDLKSGLDNSIPVQPLHQRDSRRRSLFFAGAKNTEPAHTTNTPAVPCASGQQPPQRQRRGMFTANVPTETKSTQPAASNPGSGTMSSPPPEKPVATPVANSPAASAEPPIESESSGAGLSALIRIACSCGNRIRIKQSKAGQSIRCPKCDKSLKIPDAAVPTLAVSSVATEFPRKLQAYVTDLQTEVAVSPVIKKKSLSYFALRSLTSTLHAYRNDRGDIELVRKAIEELGASGDGRAFPLLAELWELERDALRSSLTMAMGTLRDPRALIFLLNLLTHPSGEVRLVAIQGLGATEDSRAVLPLMWFGQFDSKHKFSVSDALMKIGVTAQRPLVKLLEQQDEALLADAVLMLGRLQSSNAVRPLMELLTTGRASSARGQVAEALGLIGDERAVSTLIPLLTDRDEKVRVLAATALSRIPHAQSLSALMQGLGDTNLEVRKRCAIALGEIGDPRAAGALVPLLGDPSQELRIAVAEALGRIGDERALPALVRMLHDPDEAVILKSIMALRKIKDSQAVPPLMELLGHENSRIRQRVVDALGQLGDAVVAEKLELILKTDRAEDVRAAAAKSLGEIKDPGSVDALVHAVQDAFAVRCKAIVSLGEIGDETTVPLLISLLKDTIPEARYHASLALAEMQCRLAVPQLESLLDDSNAMVRRGASKALEKLGLGEADLLSKGVTRRGINRSGKGFGRVLAALTPDALLGVFRGGSPARNAIAAAIIVVPLLAIGGYYWMTATPAAEQVIVVRGFVSALDFSNDAQQVVIGRTGGAVEVFDTKTGNRRQLIQTESPLSSILGITFTPDGKQFVCTDGKTAGGFDFNGKSLWTVDGHAQQIVEMTATKDGSRVLIRSRDGIISFWKLPDGTRIGAPIKLPTDKLNATTLSPDAKLIAGAGRKGPVSVWQAETGELMAELTGIPQEIKSICFSRDGSQVAASSLKGEIAIWSYPAGELLTSTQAEPSGQVSHLSFSADASQLFCIHNGAAIGRWQIAEQKFEVIRLAELSQANTLAVTSDGSQVVIGGEENSAAIIYDLTQQKTVKVLDVKQ